MSPLVTAHDQLDASRPPKAARSLVSTSSLQASPRQDRTCLPTHTRIRRIKPTQSGRNGDVTLKVGIYLKVMLAPRKVKLHTETKNERNVLNSHVIDHGLPVFLIQAGTASTT